MITIPSLPKLILLILLIAAVWYGFRFLGTVERARKQAERAMRQGAARQAAGRQGATRGGPGQDISKAEDTVKCRVCGAYVPVRQPARCGRADCAF
jgi:hypothetical protein